MYKLAIVVRTDTEMRKGKMAGQVGHACTTVTVLSLTSNKPDGLKELKFTNWFFLSNQTKAVLRVTGEPALEEIAKAAEEKGLMVVRIKDAGHTQLEPGTFTCVAIGPDEESLIDSVTGHLKLL